MPLLKPVSWIREVTSATGVILEQITNVDTSREKTSGQCVIDWFIKPKVGARIAANSLVEAGKWIMLREALERNVVTVRKTSATAAAIVTG